MKQKWIYPVLILCTIGIVCVGCGKSKSITNGKTTEASVSITNQTSTSSSSQSAQNTAQQNSTKAQTSSSSASQADEAIKMSAVYEMYASEVERRIKNYDGVVLNYAIYDLDHDTIPELLVNYGRKFNVSKTDILRFLPDEGTCKQIGTIDGRGVLYVLPTGNQFYNDIAFHGHATVNKCVLTQDSVTETQLEMVAYAEDYNGNLKYDPDYNVKYKNGTVEVEYKEVKDNTPAVIRSLADN